MNIELFKMASEAYQTCDHIPDLKIPKEFIEHLAKLAAAKEREAIYQLVMEAPFKEFDRQEEDFDGEAANAMKAMAFSLTSAIRARGEA